MDYRSTNRGSECLGIVRIRLPLGSTAPDLTLKAGGPDIDRLKVSGINIQYPLIDGTQRK